MAVPREIKSRLLLSNLSISSGSTIYYFRHQYNAQYTGPFTTLDPRIAADNGNPVQTSYIDKQYDLCNITVYDGDIMLYLVDIYGNVTNAGLVKQGYTFSGTTYDFYVGLPTGGSGTTRSLQVKILNDNNPVYPNPQYTVPGLPILPAPGGLNDLPDFQQQPPW